MFTCLLKMCDGTSSLSKFLLRLHGHKSVITGVGGAGGESRGFGVGQACTQIPNLTLTS